MLHPLCPCPVSHHRVPLHQGAACPEHHQCHWTSVSPSGKVRGGLNGEGVTGELMWLLGCRQTGLVVLGPAGDPELESCRRSLGAGDILDTTALAQRFPGLQLQPDQVALWDSTGGVLFADRALRAVQVGAAKGMGWVSPNFVPVTASCHHPLPRTSFASTGAPCGMGRRCCTLNLGMCSPSPPLPGCTEPPSSSSQPEPGPVLWWHPWVSACRCR